MRAACKSTVLSMIAGLNPPTGGGIVLAGREVCEAGPDRGVVFQAPSLLPWMTALQNVMLGVSQVAANKSKAERRDIAAHYLNWRGVRCSDFCFGPALHPQRGLRVNRPIHGRCHLPHQNRNQNT